MSQILPPELSEWMPARDIDRLAACLARTDADTSAGESTLDLSALKWIDLLPFAYIRLWLHAVGLRGQKNVVVVLPTLPRSSQELARLPRACPQRVALFLAKWGIGECFKHANIRLMQNYGESDENSASFEVEPDYQTLDEIEYVGPSCLLPTKQSVTEFAEALNSPVGPFYKRVQQHGALTDPEIAEHAFLLVEELGNNIFDHNSDEVFGVACHRLVTPFDAAENRAEREDARRKSSATWEQPFFDSVGAGGYLEFVIGDNGSGIAATLAGHGTATRIKDHKSALKHAFERFSSSRDILTTRMRGLYCVLENLRHVRGSLSVFSNGLRLTYHCFEDNALELAQSAPSGVKTGTFYRILIPLAPAVTEIRDTPADSFTVEIPIAPETSRLQTIPVHAIWQKHRGRQTGPLDASEASLDDLRAILENPSPNTLYILDFAGLNWPREQCNAILKPIIQAWRQHVPFVMTNVSQALSTHMQFADRDYLFHEYFCILPILGKHPFWVGLNPASKTESNLEVSLSSCAAAMYKGQPIPSHMRFVAARKEYPDVSVFWKDNPTIFSTTAAGDAGPMATLCLDAKGIFESLAPAFQNALQDYLVSVPGVLSQKDGVAYELPGGGYTDKFFDLRGLLINLPFKDALYEQAADLVERIANLVSANTVAAYGEVGAKLLGALERRKIDLKQVELGGWRELGAIRPADFFESGDRTLILTDVIGLGHAAKQIASMVRTAEGTPVAIIALLDTRQSERAGESVDNIQVHVLAYSPTNHWLEQPDGKEIVRFDPQKNPCDRLGEANVPEVILSPHQFWSLIQRSRSLHIGHRAVGGKRLRLHISSTKLAKDPVVKQYLVKQLQLFARGEGPYHFVLVPSRQQSESATRFRTHLKEAFPKAEFVLHNPESIDILSAHPAPHILIFDYGTFTGNTISSLLASCPAGAKVSIFLLVDRMSVDTWRTLKSTARDSIGRMAALYRFVPSDVIVPTESQLFYRAEALGRLEPWAATHRMLEYIEDQREALTLPMETESEADEAEPSSFGSAPVETITVIDSHASECRANSTVAELIQMLSARREPRTATNPGALYDEHIRHGIARDLASRTSDPVTILDVVAKVGSPNVRAELLNSFFLERSWRWPVLKEAVASRLPTLLESAGKAGSVRETEAIFHVLAILDKPLFLKSLGRLLKYVGSNDRLLCALSFEVVRLLEEDGPQGKATSDAVRETIAALRQINPPPVAPETVRRFLENIGFIWDPNATPPTKRLGYDEFFDKVVMECFPAELLCRHLTDHLFQRFGKDSRVSVWRLNPDRNELQCIAASPPLGEGRTYTQTENRLTGIPAKSERRSVLIQDITDEAELNRLQIDPHLVKDFVAWTTEQGYELLSVILLPIEDRHGFFGVCRVMKMCRGAQRRLDAADLEWVRSRLERFRKVAPEYGVARRDLAFASRLGRKLAAVVWDDSHSVRERIDNICQTINESLAVQWSAIAWLDKDRDVLTRCGCAGRGWTEASKHREMPRQTQSFLSWRVLESGIASYSPDLHGGPNPTSPPMEFLHSCIALPLVHGETCCGVLTLWSDLREGLSRLWADKGCLDLVSIETAQVVAQIHSLARARDAQAAQDIARRMSYSLRSRTGVLESELYLLKHQLGSAHEGALDHLEECVRFFKRSSLLASNIISLDRTGVLANAHCDLKEAVIRVCGLLHDGRIRLSIDTDTVVVSGERDRVEDILLELLRNATYFAPIQAGQIDVTLTADDRYARVDVQDNGPGIHPDLKPRLFQMFACYPVDRTGLGLHYARSLAQAFGGDLNETSEVQMGAHFVLRLKRPIN